MKVGNRLFPYPILNNSKPLFSAYKSGCKFELQYRVEETKDSFVLADTYCVLECELLNSLVREGKADIVLYIECPQTLLRETHSIGLTPQDIEISYYNVNGPISFSAFIVAKEDISDVTSSDFFDEYTDNGIKFYIEKHDILAVDEGYVHTIDIDEEETPKKDSIFVISLNKDEEERAVKYYSDHEKIVISLPGNAFTIYRNTGRLFKDIYLSLFGVPSLVESLYRLKIKYPKTVDSDGFDESAIENEKVSHKWFRVFCNTFERINSRPFTDDDFENINSEVQKVFDYITLKSVNQIDGLTFKSMEGRNDED